MRIGELLDGYTLSYGKSIIPERTEEGLTKIVNLISNYGVDSHKVIEIIRRNYSDVDWDSFYFKGQPQTNKVKSILKQLEVNLDNNTLSKLLSEVRQIYPKKGTLTVYLITPKFFGTPEWEEIDLGDTDSCFASGRCNSTCKYFICHFKEQFRFVIYMVEGEGYYGVGRSWYLGLPTWDNPSVVYLTNFYDKGIVFSIKSKMYRLPIARALEQIFNREFIVKDEYVYLPIYENGDGFLLVEKDKREEVHDIISEFLYTKKYSCDRCKRETSIDSLVLKDGDICCPYCEDDSYFTCNECGERVHEEEVIFYEDTPYCEDCFDKLFFFCCECEEPFPREDGYDVYISRNDYHGKICRYCYNEKDNYQECEICEEIIVDPDLFDCLYIKRDSVYVSEGYFCSECSKWFFECPECEASFVVINASGTYSDEFIKSVLSRLEGCPFCNVDVKDIQKMLEGKLLPILREVKNDEEIDRNNQI